MNKTKLWTSSFSPIRLRNKQSTKEVGKWNICDVAQGYLLFRWKSKSNLLNYIKPFRKNLHIIVRRWHYHKSCSTLFWENWQRWDSHIQGTFDVVLLYYSCQIYYVPLTASFQCSDQLLFVRPLSLHFLACLSQTKLETLLMAP